MSNRPTSGCEAGAAFRAADHGRVAPYLIAMIVSSLVLGALLSHQSVTFISEKPYIESAFLIAVEGAPDGWTSTDGTWTEHPPFPRLLYQTLADVCGRDRADRTFQRMVSSIFHALTVALWTVFLLSGDVRGHHRSVAVQLCLVTAVIAALSSPPTLLNAIRAGGEALHGFCGTCTLIAIYRFALSGRFRLIPLVAASATLFVWSNCYATIELPALVAAGFLFSLVSGRRSRAPRDATPRSESVPNSTNTVHPVSGAARTVLLALAVTPALASAFCDDFALPARMRTLVGHYWAVPAIGEDFTVLPFSFLWRGALQLRDPGMPLVVPDVLNACTWIAFAVLGACRITSHRTMFIGTSAALIAIALAILSHCHASPVLVPHDLGFLHMLWMLLPCCLLLDMCRAAHNMELRLLLCGLTVAASGFQLMPLLGYVREKAFSGGEIVSRVCHSVESQHDGDQPIVFAGSRTYVLFQSCLGVNSSDAARVYMREGLYPDNFTSRTLIDPKLLLYEQDLASLHSQAIVFVRVEAAQSVSIELSPWTVERFETVPHPCNSIGTVYIMRLQPREVSAQK